MSQKQGFVPYLVEHMLHFFFLALICSFWVMSVVSRANYTKCPVTSLWKSTEFQNGSQMPFDMKIAFITWKNA